MKQDAALFAALVVEIMIMPSLSEFDAERIRIILDELERTTRLYGPGPMMRLERNTETEGAGGVIVRGLATRRGALRLGLRIARDALDRDYLTIIDDAARPGEIDSIDAQAGVIELVLSDDPLLPPRSGNRPDGHANSIACATVFWLCVGTFLVGFVTIIVFLARLVNRWISG